MNNKVALVSIGYWGKNLLRNLNNLGVLAAAFDKDQKVIDKYTKDRIYSDIYFGLDWEVCLANKEIKGVVIASPPNLHYEMAMKVLKAGKHVFVEKPLTTDVEQAKILLEKNSDRAYQLANRIAIGVLIIVLVAMGFKDFGQFLK
jgi:UDP-2-acetamido-3-amino-2,3-dideoxy-glucuronate N-acetyltransferase